MVKNVLGKFFILLKHEINMLPIHVTAKFNILSQKARIFVHYPVSCSTSPQLGFYQ